MLAVIIENENQRRRFARKCRDLNVIIGHEKILSFPYNEMIVGTSFGSYSLPKRIKEKIPTINEDNINVVSLKIFEQMGKDEL